MPGSIIHQLEAYLKAPPAEIFRWEDPESDAVGVLVVDSWAFGACGGGTRMVQTLNVDEVVALAKVMGLKFSLFGPKMAGAKSCIAIAPDHPDKAGVLRRWLKAIEPYLKKGYGTAADLNTDYTTIARHFHDMGYAHPQQGIWRASGMDQLACAAMAGRMRIFIEPVALTLQVHLPLAELVTGYAVAKAISCAYACLNIAMKHKTAVIQGIGTVGAAAAYYLGQWGVKIIGVIDEHGAVSCPEGLSEDALLDMLQTHQLPSSNHTVMAHTDFYQALSHQRVHIGVPAAGSYLMDATLVKQWSSQGLEVMACGANLPFEDAPMYGDTARKIDQAMTLIPSCVASGGMARAFAMVMQAPNDDLQVEDVFTDIAVHIDRLMTEAMQAYGGKHVAAFLYAKALSLK